MTTARRIEHIPINLGLNQEIEPPGRLRLSYTTDWGGWLPDRTDWEWDIDKLTAEFGVGSDFSSFVRIEFEGPMIFRVLDETWLSMATDSSLWSGDLTTFAREVVGDDFAILHSMFFELNPDAKHYQFVTSTACLDVLAVSPPQSSLHTVAG
jgi:hypothetical protein